MSKTTLTYKDIAPRAAKDAVFSSADKTAQSDMTLLPDGIQPEPTMSLETNYWGLNGTFDYPWNQSVAFQSTEMSGSDCVFVHKPTITMSFSMQHTSTGLTFVFDEANGGYCTDITIAWYQGNTKLTEQDFTPDAPKFVCNKIVQHYDRIVVTLNKTSLPHRYARLQQVIFGIYREFGMDEIRDASVVNETGLLSQEIPVSTLKWTLDNRHEVDYIFQFKQPVEVKNDDFLIGVYYIDGHNRSSKTVYSIDCYDAIGVLSETPFAGGYYKNKSAKALLAEIIEDDFVIEYDDDVVDMNLSGYIPEDGDKRSAMQQVLFPWGVCASTDGRNTIRIFKLPTQGKEMTMDRTYEGANVDVSSLVTEVQVTAHSYTLNGDDYKDTTTVFTVKNPDVTATDKRNVVSITSATMVSPEIGQAVAQMVYDYYMRRNTINATIVWKGEALGDFLTLPNSWGGSNSGNVAKMEIKLSNTVAAALNCVGV